jgi:TonB-linked SusC/RagA family outer membrane protein
VKEKSGAGSTTLCELLVSYAKWSSFLATSVFAQERTVSGKVTAEESGTPIPGVNVILKGTTVGTVTDIDGNYKLNVPADGGTLVFSFIGLATEEVRIGSQSVIDMLMTADIKQLTEVVVTAVGIEADRATLGYSIQTVNSDEIVSSGEANLVNALNQKAAGVFVYSSAGSPGASASVRIRGNTSINLGNSPLFVVDGVPIDNSESGNGVDGVDQSNRAIDINPNDISTLTVLKGPAATVLYGIRAANGAIIITTKRGKKGKPKIEFSTNYTASQVNKLVEQQDKYAQGRPSGGAPLYRGPETREGFSWGPAISDLEYATDPNGALAPPSSVFTPEGDFWFDKNGYLVPKGQGNGTPAQAYDNYDNFFVTGHSTDNNLSVSGGNDAVTYYMSTGYTYKSGVVPNADWSRISVLGKISADITDDITIGFQANYMNSGGYRVQRGSNISGVMLGLGRNTPTFDAANGYTDGRDAVADKTTYTNPDGTQRSYRWGIYDSPFWAAAKNPYEDDVNRIIGNVSASWRVTPWLTVSYKLGLDTYHDRRISAFDINSASVPEGQITQTDISSNDLNSDLLFLFNTDITQDLSFNATVGHNYYSTQGITRGATGTEMGAPEWYNLANTTNVTAYENIGEKKIHGVFGDFKFAYANFLFLNVSMRNDWSSALPAENNSFFYPAISLGWTFTENLGLSTNPVFSYGKLRASWGQVGNDAPIYATSTPYYGAFNGGDGFINGIGFPAYGTNAFERSNQLGNPDLQAELTSTIEVGGEFQFFQGKFGFDFTWYSAETDGQVIGVNLSPSTGFNSVLKNAGLIKNTGYEVILNATPVQAGDFTWDMNFNFTAYETDVVSLDPSVGEGGITLAGFTSTSSRVIEGQPYGVIFGGQYKRVNDEVWPNTGKLEIGTDGWPINEGVSGPIGDPNPDWLLGFRNTFSWKGLSLSTLFDFRQGGDMWNGTNGVMAYWGVTKETGDDRNVQGYVYDGMVNTGTAEAPVYVQNTTPVDFANPAAGIGANKWVRYGFGFSDNEIEDTSWIRLRELTLAYAFPKSLIKGIENLTLSFTGRNLWLKTNYSGIDPEANLTGASNGFGLEYFGMPNTKSYGVNLRIGF